MTADTPTDKLGTPINVGDFIVYGHAMGRSAGLRIGRVLKLDRAAEDSYGSYRGGGWRIRVQGVNDDWSRRDPELCKPGTLQFPERTVVVMPRAVPEKIRKLFDAAAVHE